MLFFFYLRIPMIGIAGGIFAAFPLLYYCLTSGVIAGFAILLFTAILLLPLSGSFSISLFYLLQCGMPSLLLALFLRLSKGGYRSLLYSAASSFILLVAAAVLFAYNQGIDPHTAITREIEQSISQGITLIKSSGASQSDVQSILEGIEQVKRVLITVYPSMLLLWITLIIGSNLYVLSLVKSRLPESVTLGRFDQFRNPDSIVWILIVAGFAQLFGYPEIKLISLNILIVVCAAYFIQGSAVISGLFERFSVSKIFRSFFYLFLVFQPYLVAAVLMLGIFDIWGDFRTPRKQKNL